MFKLSVRGTQAKCMPCRSLPGERLLLVCFPRAMNGGHVAFELEAMNSDDL
jgi:hypothetical protein